MKRITTGETKKNDAIKFLMQFEAKQKVKPKLKSVMLSVFAKEYNQFIETKFSKSHLKCTKSTFKHLLNLINDIPLNKINSRTLETFLIAHYKKSKHGALLFYRVLNAAFNKAINWEYIESNPMKSIKPPKVPANNPLFITADQLEKILVNVENPILRDFYIFSFHSGMRAGEIINLKWNQVSLNDKLIRVTNTKEFSTKGKRERVIPINEKLFNLLSNKLPKFYDINNPGYVFNKHGFKFNLEYVSKGFKKALRKTEGIDPKIHLHSLRHSFASNIVKQNVSLYVVKELLGHKKISTTEIYSHVAVDTLRNAVNVL